MRWRVLLTAGFACLAAAPIVATASFDDVPTDHPQAAAISVAVAEGWFEGYEDGTFRPDEPVKDRHVVAVFRRVFPDSPTRAEMAAVMKAGMEALTATDSNPTGSQDEPRLVVSETSAATSAASAPSTSTSVVATFPSVIDEHSESVLLEGDWVRQVTDVESVVDLSDSGRLLVSWRTNRVGNAPWTLMFYPDENRWAYKRPRFRTDVEWAMLADGRWQFGSAEVAPDGLPRFHVDSQHGGPPQMFVYRFTQHPVSADGAKIADGAYSSLTRKPVEGCRRLADGFSVRVWPGGLVQDVCDLPV